MEHELADHEIVGFVEDGRALVALVEELVQSIPGLAIFLRSVLQYQIGENLLELYRSLAQALHLLRSRLLRGVARKPFLPCPHQLLRQVVREVLVDSFPSAPLLER